MAVSPGYRSEGSNCTAWSRRDELGCLMKTLLRQEIKGLVSEFEAKAVLHCQDVIDQVFGSCAKRADDKLNLRAPQASKPCTLQKGPILHQSMFALEASFAESALFGATRKRRPSLNYSSSNPTSLQASQMMVGKASLKHNGTLSPKSVVLEQSSEKMPAKVIDENGMAVKASSNTDELPPCTYASFDSEPTSKQARSDSSRRLEEVAVLELAAQPPQGKMLNALDSKREIKPPNFVAEEELSQSDGLSIQAVRRGFSHGDRSTEVLPTQRSEDEVACASHCKGISTFSPILPCGTSSSRRTHSLVLPTFQPKDGLVRADKHHHSSPVKGSSMSSSSSSSSRIELANLESLQRHLNEKLTRPTSLETPQEVVFSSVQAPDPLPQVDDDLALEDACESSSDSELGIESNVDVRPPFLLKALGIYPLCRVGAFNMYHVQIVILLMLGCIVESVMAMLAAQKSNHRDHLVMEISSLIMNVGTLFCHVALSQVKRNNYEMLGLRSSLLGTYAQKMNLRLVWQRTSMWQEVFATILWGSAVVVRFVSGFQDLPFWIQAVDTVCLAFITSVFVGDMLCLLHITNGLVLLVDSYCCRLVHDEYRSATLFTLTTEWNKLQALLRRASAAMTPCMVLAQMIVVANFVTFGWALFLNAFSIDFHNLLSILWPAFGFMLLVVAHLVRAAQVTGRCSRVPAFINSHCGGKNMLRSQLVEYTQHSAAGFYVYEVKLTAAAVMKMAYVVGIGSLTAITRLTLLAGL